jgi:hypothetical protein
MHQRLLFAIAVGAMALTCSGNNTNNGGGTPASGNSVLERNNHPNRDGHFIQPTLTKAMAATMALDAGFNATFTGNMWASPLYLENGPNGKGAFFAVTTGNDVYALDETDGHVVWTQNIGTSPTANGVSCGNIHPLGILSTPVIDAQARTIYVAGAIGDASAIMSHQVHALSVDDGKERAGWPVDVSGTLGFDPRPANQRSALSLVGGILYVAYGGHIGDCGDYRGRVVAIKTSDPTQVTGWATGGKGEAIWAAGGMASDGTSLYATTGNNTAGASTHADSEEVVRLTGMATLGAGDKNVYYPSRWRDMDGNDADLGANSPLYITTPASYVVAISKDGHLYLLDSANLGGSDGHKVDYTVAQTGMSIHTAPAAYTTAQNGMHVIFSTDNNAVGCPAGGAAGQVVMSVQIPAGSPPAPKTAWCAALGGTVTAPIATTTDGKNDAVVWYMSNNKLVAVDGDTGASIFAGGSDTCSGVRKWTSPIAVKGRIIVGGDGHLCSWSPH